MLLGGQRRARNRQEGPGATAPLVDGAREDVLARAALTRQQDRRVGRRGAPGHADGAAHRCARGLQHPGSRQLAGPVRVRHSSPAWRVATHTIRRERASTHDHGEQHANVEHASCRTKTHGIHRPVACSGAVPGDLHDCEPALCRARTRRVRAGIDVPPVSATESSRRPACRDRDAQTAPRAASALQGPAPRAAMYRNTKQYSTASSPWFSIGSSARQPCPIQ